MVKHARLVRILVRASYMILPKENVSTDTVVEVSICGKVANLGSFKGVNLAYYICTDQASKKDANFKNNSSKILIKSLQ